MKLGLGTVQFGLPYGISNSDGQVPVERVKEILSLARDSGIYLLDTAHEYGSSEKVLGDCLAGSPGTFRIITKTPHFKKNRLGPEEIKKAENAVHQSLQNLKASVIDGLMIHRAEDLLIEGGKDLFEALRKFKDQGLIRSLGVSVYHSAQIDEILARYSIDLIQLPLNMLDQRLLTSGHLSQLKKHHVEIHVRSAFLQGLLLMPLEKVSTYFSPILPVLQKYRDLLSERQMTPVEGALHFLSQITEIDHLIVGVCHPKELQEIVNATRRCEGLDPIDYSPFSVTDPKMIDPSQWKL